MPSPAFHQAYVLSCVLDDLHLIGAHMVKSQSKVIKGTSNTPWACLKWVSLLFTVHVSSLLMQKRHAALKRDSNTN